jgi:hypothetical protein
MTVLQTAACKLSGRLDQHQAQLSQKLLCSTNKNSLALSRVFLIVRSEIVVLVDINITCGPETVWQMEMSVSKEPAC